MYNPQELQRKAQLNLHGVDTNAQTSLNNNNPPKQESEQNWFVRGLATIGNFVNNIVMGAVKSIEGIVDAGAMLVGLFGADVDDFVSYDFTADIFGADEEGEGLLEWSWGRNLAEVSYLDNENIVNQIAEGVGGLLPTVAIGILTGGTSLAGTAASAGAKAATIGAKIAQTGTFVASAMGNASESALQEGATYGQALGYGALSGAIEAGTEMIGGRVIGSATKLDNTLLGKLAIKTGADKFISKSVGKAAYSFASEGLEEVVADLLDPVNKRITGVDSEATVNWAELPKTFLIGGAVGSILDGVQNGASALIHKDKGGKHFVSVAESLEDISNTNKALAYLQQHKGITQERINNATIRSSERMMDSIEKISDGLQSMTDKQRKLTFDTLRESTSFVDDSFNSDGTIKEEVRNNYAEVMNNGAIYNVSSDLVYRGSEIENEIKAVNEEYNMNIELSDTTFTENQRKSFAKINRSVAKLNEKVSERISIVAIKDNPNNVNAFIDKNTIYINEKYLEDGQWARYLSHEVSHFAKKSKEFNSFAEYITSDDKVLADVVLKVDGAYKYDFDLNTAKEIISKIQNGKKVSERESEFYDEVVAHITEDLFTNEDSINRLVKDNSNLASKILNRIKQFLQIFKGTNADKNTVINLRKAEMLFEKALSSIGKQNKEFAERYEKGIAEYIKAKKKYDTLSEEQRESWLKDNDWNAEDFADDAIGDSNELDNSGEIRYSKKGYAERNPKSVTEKEFNHHYWAVASNLLLKEEIGVLNSAIGNMNRGEVYNKNSDGFFMIPVGEKGILNKIIFTDGKKGSYSINSIIEIACDNETDLTDIRSVVYARERNGIHTENSDLFKIYYSKDFRYNDFIAKIQNYSQDSNGEQVGTRSSRKVRFSLKEELNHFSEIKIEDGKEYHRLERELKRRNGNRPSEIDWAMTDKYLYIVKDNTLNGFTPIVQIDCAKHEKLFMRLIRMIDYENYSSEKTIEKWLDEIYSHPNLFNWTNDNSVSASQNEEIAITSSDNQVSSNKDIDSKGRKLSNEQIEFFKDSKVRDRYGRLREVYHGTYGEFYTFDKALLGKNFGADAKLGFFFTASKTLAEDYSKNAKENKRFNIIHKVADGNDEVLNFLSNKNNFNNYDAIKNIIDKDSYDEVREIDNALDENLNDIYDVYLNIQNPYVENWERKAHYKLDMIRAITKAKSNGHDGVIIKRVDASVAETRPASDLYVVFEPNQIKLTTNKKPTTSNDIRFSRKDKADINQYTEKQYNDFGWARVNGILSINENEDFKTKYRQIKDGTLNRINKSINGEILVEVNNSKGADFAVNNTLVYAKGSYDNYKITKIIKINLNYETDIESIRRNIYEWERRGWTRTDAIIERVYGKELVRIYRLGDCPSYRELKQQGRNSVTNKTDNSFLQNGRRNLDQDSETIKFSLKDNATYTLSDGQVKKKVANFTKLKVYSKVEAESIINSILETNFNLEDYSVRISGKTKADAIDVLWKTLNTADAGKRTGISLKIADYIIDNTIIESIYLEEENQIYTETISFLKPYLHSVDLKALKGEIKYRYDTDNSVYLLWGKRKGEDGQTADQIAMELAESGFFIDAENEADIFFEMDRAYREAVRALKKKSDKFLADTLGKEERDKLRQDIAKDILRAFDSNGKKSKLAEIIEQQKERAKVWKDLYYEEKQRNSAINNLLYEVGKIRDIHFGDFQNSTQSHNLLFRGSIERLSAIKHRGDLNKSGTRSIVAGLNEWYSKDNPVVGDRFIEDISFILNKISSGTGKLTAEEIKGLATAVAYFRHFIETNNKIFRAGKYIDAKPIVEDYIKKITETQNLKISWAGKVFDKLFNNSKLNYMQTFNDPMTIARYMDKYGDGFFTQTLESFREGAVNSAILEMELNASVEEFYDKHKKFLKNLKAKTIKYNNVEIPADKALYLYMALNREQALMGLARSGFSYKDDKGKTIRVAGFETNEDLTLDDIKIIASEVQSELEKQFTEEEIEYIKIAEKLFNEDCKKLKSERDKTRLGYSNIVDDYYIPIRRAYIAQSVDVDSLQFELDRVSNLSFNKSAVKGAKNELFIESLDLVLSRHLRGIAQYYHLSNVIDNFNIIYNMDISGNANRVKSIASESVNVWNKGKTYLQDLISDIQGIKRGEGSRVFGFIRGSYAKYQLGANPKVWFTQLSSFFASTSILDYSSVIKGLAIKTGDVDKYCSLAKLRNNDNTVALAQGVLDKVDKVSNVLMKPIGMTDRLVVKKLFGACQVQVQKNTGLKIGTEENKVKAGELLQKVILETQQNTMATERSQAMRSSSELMKTLTMFTSDSMKVIGRVIDSYGELSILKARRKATTDASEKANLDKQIKTARKKAAKSTSALVTTAIFMALIAQAFRTLYNKDDEEDNIVENMTVDAVGNLFGGLPIFKDVYAKLVEGYDFDGYQYSAINDLLDSMSDVINLTGDIFSGNADSRDVALNIKKMSYAVGQLFGIPVRNVYNVFYGLTKRVSPETAYKIDDVFYKQSYSSDLKKAIKNNDEEMIATIAGLIMDENIGAFENGSTRNEVNRLLSAGFDVLPQTVGNSMTINEVQYTLTGPQKENFKKVYSQSISAVDKLVSSNGYKIATDEAKAKAIKYIYKYYYYEAQYQALNADLDSKLYLFGQIVPIEKMALALAEVPLLVENSTNKKKTVQRYLQATKLSSAQKYMLMRYFGYKNTKGEGVVKSAINKTSLTKEQKKLLLEKCGY